MYFRNMFFHSLFLRAVKEQILNEKFTQIWYKELSLQKIISLYDPGNFIGQVVRAYLNTSDEPKLEFSGSSRAEL